MAIWVSQNSAVAVAFIGFLGTVITVVFAYLMARMKMTMEEYHKSVNSKMDMLLALTQAAALAEGHLAGIEAERKRRAIQDSDRAVGEVAGRQTEKDLHEKPPGEA